MTASDQTNLLIKNKFTNLKRQNKKQKVAFLNLHQLKPKIHLNLASSIWHKQINLQTRLLNLVLGIKFHLLALWLAPKGIC
ncbi:hypothetical protein MTT09_00990 [Campylobacter concisus]|jgi:hypothetical protein|uniref:hypothetical protein n=1 Tax=Campylobacter concisus TaxID=199 RepID=UPI003D203732